MRTGRAYLAAAVMTTVLGGSSVVYSQGADVGTVNARISSVLANIQTRLSSASNQDAKNCLNTKKNSVNSLRGGVNPNADLQSILSQVNAIAADLDSCTGEKSGDNKDKGKGGDGKGDSTTPGAQMKVDSDTPDPGDDNSSVIIAPGPIAQGDGVVDNTTGGGPDGTDTGSTGGVDVTSPVGVVPPPDESPTN